MNPLAAAVVAAFLCGSIVTGGIVWNYKDNQQERSLLKKEQSYQAVINQANKEKQDAEAKAVQVEHEAAKGIAQVSNEYQDKLKEKNDQLAKALIKQRDPAKRLYIRAPANACGNSKVSGITPGASGSDGKTRIELPRNVAERLIRRANRADEIVEQLGACQRVIIEDRKAINGDR